MGTTKYVIETKLGYVTSSRGYFSKHLEAARLFKTFQAASTNRYVKCPYEKTLEGKIVPVEVSIRKI